MGFTLILLSTMMIMLSATEADRDRQQHAREVILECEQLKQLFLASAQVMIQYYITKGGTIERRLDYILGRVPGKVNELRELVRGNAQQVERMNHVAVLCDRIQALADEASVTLQSTGEASVLIESSVIRDDFLGSLREIVPLLQSIIDDEQKVVKVATPFVRGWTMHIKVFIVVSMILTVVVSLALNQFYNRDKIQRLRVLMDNSVRLAHHKALNPPVPGGDEIAALDRIFHEMAAALHQVEVLKQDFLRMISHDLRAPLTSIRMTVNMLEEGILGSLTAKGTDMVKGADSEIGRLVGLINELLDVEKMESGQLDMDQEWTALGAVLRQSATAVLGMARPRSIEIDVPESELDVWADSGRLVQVFVNLISNAIKFSPDGSRITLLVEADADGRMVKLGVRDQGRGVPAHLREVIFERFKQVEKSDATAKGGTGLGLFICKMIVELHGGTIWVESEDGQGSTFWFTVPLERPVTSSSS